MLPFMYYYIYFVSYGFAFIVSQFTIFKKYTKKAFYFDSLLHFLAYNPII